MNHEHPCGCDHEHSKSFPDVLNVDTGIEITFQHDYPVSQEKLWEYLSHNELLQQWYPQLVFTDFNPGGRLLFQYEGGNFEEMLVMDVEAPCLLSFTWDIHTVTFQVTALGKGQSRLSFTQWVSEMNHHVPVDLCGWYLALLNLERAITGDDKLEMAEVYHHHYPQIVDLLNLESDFEFINPFG